MQATGDVFLGWVTSDDGGDRPRDFYVRQLWDGKWSADVELMGPSQRARYARLCGGPSRGPTPARETASRSPRTSAPGPAISSCRGV